MIKFDFNFCWKTRTYTGQELETDLENRKKAELYNYFQVKLATKNLLELEMHLRRPAANFILLCINNLVIVLLIIDGPCQLPVLESWLHTITGSHIILLLSAKQHVEPNQDARVQPTSRKISLTHKNISCFLQTTYKFMEDVTLTITYQAFHLPAMIKRNTQSEWRTKVRLLLQ